MPRDRPRAFPLVSPALGRSGQQGATRGIPQISTGKDNMVDPSPVSESKPSQGSTSLPDASKFAAHVEQVTIGDTALTLPAKGLTAVVGGNNVGKSTILRELVVRLALGPGLAPTSQGPMVLLQDLKLDTAGSADDVVEWLRQNAHLVTAPVEGFVSRHGGNNPLPPASVIHYWNQTDRLGPLERFIVHYTEPMSREGMLGPVQQRPDISDPPSHPLHRLADDSELLQELSDICQQIFRYPLTLDRLSANLTLRVGAVGMDAPPVDRVTTAYREAVASLPPVGTQGQGMKSMLGLLLPVLTGTSPIIIIDEPEAFLHPPQAFQLGEILATLANERGLQVLLATHDRNLLAGLLSPGAPVSVIRLDRIGDVTSASQLHPTDVANLWNDPVLRYSNVLDGVFHRVVVVAEADGDCRFFGAGLDALNKESPLPVPPSEVLFVPAGGKDGIAKIVQALVAVDVNVVASPDLDILVDESKLRKLVEAFGGDWNDFSADYRVVMNEFHPTQTGATCGDVLAAVHDHLNPLRDEPWTKEVKAGLAPALRTSESKMAELKRYGVQAFGQGTAARAKDMLDRLDALGICALRNGELERLAPDVGVGKGPAWLSAALEQGAHHNQATKEHLERVLKSAIGPT